MLTYSLNEEEVMKTVFVDGLDDLPNMVMRWAIAPSYLVRNFCLYNLCSVMFM